MSHKFLLTIIEFVKLNVCSESSGRYMRCQSFNKEFKAGDNLEFKQGNKTAGVFTVTWHHNCSVSSVSVEMFFV